MQELVDYYRTARDGHELMFQVEKSLAEEMSEEQLQAFGDLVVKNYESGLPPETGMGQITQGQ